MATLTCEAANPRIIKNISNSMTDRCIVNMAVTKKLAELREGETDIRNFFCSVHPLDTFAEAADAAIKEEEKDIAATHCYGH